MSKIYIPDVAKEVVELAASNVKPVVRFGGVLHYIKPVDIFSVAYTWEPKKAEPAVDLVPLIDITTYHSFGYHAFFKPSVAEVLKQIPWLEHPNVAAFEIIKSPETVDDLNAEYEALNDGYHVATTRLYRKQ